MKYLIDKEKLDERIYKLLAGDGKNQADNVEGIALCALRGCLVPYEEKKEECEHNAGTRINGKMICDYCKQDVSGQVVMKGNPDNKEQDTRCMKCNGVGEKEGEVLLRGFPYNFKRTCNHCNGTGVEPRKEQDTRTHAWETPVSKQTYYSQDEVRKMLEDLKMRDNLAGNSKEVQEDRRHMNANIDKKIAEL